MKSFYQISILKNLTSLKKNKLKSKLKLKFEKQFIILSVGRVSYRKVLIID